MPAIRPEAVISKKKSQIPELVFDAFNELIARDFDGKTALVLQRQLEDLIMYKMKVSRKDIIENKWLDIECFYREAGWSVVYNGLDVEYSYEPFFKFTCK